MTDTTTVALTGGDGAGKTTIAKRLVERSSVPIFYLYMGPNIESSNVALPWSRLILRMKLRSYRRVAKKQSITDPGFVSTHHIDHRKVQRGPIGATLRMINRLLEAAFRQAISWYYQRRGYIVLYDRHFLFEAAPSSGRGHRRRTDALTYWALSRFFPKPDVVIFLDAPSEILLARKREGTIASLEWKRRVTLAEGRKVARFVTIDAARPLDEVLEDVHRHIAALPAAA